MAARTPPSEETRKRKNNPAQEGEPRAESQLTEASRNKQSHDQKSRRDENRPQMPQFEDHSIPSKSVPGGRRHFAKAKAPISQTSQKLAEKLTQR
jgi:hypothetical protein